MAGYIGKSQGVTQVDGYNRSEADAEFVGVTGDTMTGNLTVPMVVTESALSNRNFIVNGGLTCWQRGTSFAHNALSNAPFCADRFWFYNSGGATSGAIEQSTDVPSGEGFAYSIFNNTNAGLPCGTNVELTKQGSAAPFVVGSTYTVSFWVVGSSPSTGTTLQVTWRNSHANGTDTSAATSFPSFDITTSWTRVVLPFTLTSSPTANNNVLDFEFGCPSGAKLTGFQLESGGAATPFEHEPFSATLQKCRRYYQNVYQRGNSSTGTYYSYYNRFSGNQVQFEPMRTAPTVSYSHTGGAFYWVNPGVTPYSADSAAGFSYGAHQPNAFSMGSIEFSQGRQAGGSTPSDFVSYRLEANLIFHLDAEL